MIQITPQVLEQHLTPAQQEKLALLQHTPAIKDVVVSLDFSLPKDYIAVVIAYHSGHDIYGGIDIDGRMST